MLVLSRKFGESIRIGDDIVLTVVGLRNRRVRIGIRCPREIPVNRMEVEECGGGSGELELEQGCSAGLPTM